MAFSRGDIAAATLFYNQPHLISTMRRLVASDPQFVPVYLTPDYSIYRWVPLVHRRAQATATDQARAVSASEPGVVTTAGGRSRKAITPTR